LSDARCRYFFQVHLLPVGNEFMDRSCFFPVISLIVLVLCNPLTVRANTSLPAFTLEMHDTLVDIMAEDVPLHVILKEISAQSGLVLRSAEMADELISCHLTAVSLTQFLEKLLVNWNYALLTKINTQGRSVPATLWVLNKNTNRLTPNDTTSPRILTKLEDDILHLPQDHVKRFKQDDVASVFADSEIVLETISTKKYVHDNHESGFEITRLTSHSPLRQIGLQEGDVVLDINGRLINSPSEIIQALAHQPEEKTQMIRIERLRDGEIDPIYIELH
jgi:hypothetical protein